jgi:hypothetical protein
MPENRINPQPHQNGNGERKENTRDVNEEHYESDADRVVHRHLKDKDDIITDEDIANLRVGAVAAEFDEATEARFDDEKAREEAESQAIGGTEDMKKDKNLEEGQITPWDTIDPS